MISKVYREVVEKFQMDNEKKGKCNFLQIYLHLQICFDVFSLLRFPFFFL